MSNLLMTPHGLRGSPGAWSRPPVFASAWHERRRGARTPRCEDTTLWRANFWAGGLGTRGEADALGALPQEHDPARWLSRQDHEARMGSRDGGSSESDTLIGSSAVSASGATLRKKNRRIPAIGTQAHGRAWRCGRRARANVRRFCRARHVEARVDHQISGAPFHEPRSQREDRRGR